MGEATSEEKVSETENVGATNVPADVEGKEAKTALNGTADTLKHTLPDRKLSGTNEKALHRASLETSEKRGDDEEVSKEET